MPDDPIETDTRVPSRDMGVPTRILCAPERRAQETANLLGLRHAREDALRDCDFGAWKGKSLEEIQRSDPGGAVLWLNEPDARPHGGESLFELRARVSRWLDALAETGHVLAVTHATVIRAAALDVLEAPFAAFWRLDIQPLSTMELRSDGKSWTVRSLNDRLAG